MEVVNHCLICLENSKLSTLDCTCDICLDCLKQYTKIQIEEFWTSDGTHLHMKCPGGCERGLYFDQIQQLAIQNHFINDIHGQLFKSYCKKSTDVQQCPNRNCEFYYLKPCKVRCVDICEICQTRLLTFESFSYTSILNSITEFYTTHECPRCEVKITKNGGCSHMTCQVCKFEFCWDCNQNCIGHDWSICIYHNIFTLIIKAQLLYTLLFSLGLDTLLRGIISLIFEVTYLFVLNNLILLISGVIVIQLKKLNEKYQKITYHRIVFATILLFTLIFIEYFIIEFTFTDWICYMMKELLYLAAVVIVITIFNSL